MLLVFVADLIVADCVADLTVADCVADLTVADCVADAAHQLSAGPKRRRARGSESDQSPG